jgi:hypothetical protein
MPIAAADALTSRFTCKTAQGAGLEPFGTHLATNNSYDRISLVSIA